MTKREDYSEDLESQYKRLERKYSEVIKNFDKTIRSKSSQEMLDSTHDFFIICYHLREWVQKDNKVDEKIKLKLPSFENDNIRSDHPLIGLQICRDLCNSFKHSKLDKKRRPNDINTKIVASGGSVFMVPIKELNKTNKAGKTMHMKEEDAIYLGDCVINFKNHQYDLLGVVESCMHFWKTFFNENNLLMPRST